MDLPFTLDQFLEVFRKYNLMVFPMQILFYILAGVAIYLFLRKRRHSATIITLILSFLWLWMMPAGFFVRCISEDHSRLLYRHDTFPDEEREIDALHSK